jgi:23S rRNA G2445 N2-methylase RlmL
VTNPPYGERLKPETLGGLYRSMARAFERLGGWRVVVLSGSPLWTREMRRKPAVSHKLWNGPLEVRLLCYDIPAR